MKDKFIKWNSIKFIQIILSNAYSFCLWYSNYLKSCNKTDNTTVSSCTMGKAFFVDNFVLSLVCLVFISWKFGLLSGLFLLITKIKLDR